MDTSKGKALIKYVKLIGDGIFTDVDFYYNSFDDVLTIMVDLKKEEFPDIDKIKNQKYLKRMIEGALSERFKDDIDIFFRHVIKSWVRRFEFEIINFD